MGEDRGGEKGGGGGAAVGVEAQDLFAAKVIYQAIGVERFTLSGRAVPNARRLAVGKRA